MKVLTIKGDRLSMSQRGSSSRLTLKDSCLLKGVFVEVKLDSLIVAN